MADPIAQQMNPTNTFSPTGRYEAIRGERCRSTPYRARAFRKLTHFPSGRSLGMFCTVWASFSRHLASYTVYVTDLHDYSSVRRKLWREYGGWPFPASFRSNFDLDRVHVARFRAFVSAETTSDYTTTNVFLLLVQIWESTQFYKQQTTQSRPRDSTASPRCDQ